MHIIYQLVVNLYVALIRLAALWNPKAKAWVTGRKDSWVRIALFEKNGTPRYWFHCASLGEFEQGRPLIEALKRAENCQVIITFFSPSGYEIRKNYEGADLIIYLPKDSKKNAKRFLRELAPTKIFFVKYEFWAGYIFEAKNKNIPIYSVSAIFRKDHIFFKWYGGFMRRILNQFDGIFVQDEGSKELLNTINVSSVVTGDTRFDRVMENALQRKDLPFIADFVGGKKVFVIGSAWEEDDRVLKPLLETLDDSWKIILAPHELTRSRLSAIAELNPKNSVFYTDLLQGNGRDKQVLMIDNIGMLMHIYQFANIAYVGGAFGKGLHNILEPASFGVPVIFGPTYHKFNEAKLFVEAGFAASIHDSTGLIQAFHKFERVGLNAEILAFMKKNVGSTETILAHVLK